MDMNERKKILFVCLGNICRSQMAECIFTYMAKKKKIDGEFEIDSAGTSDEEEGNPIYPPARRCLENHGIPTLGHRARKITKEDLEYFDIIFYMEEKNKRSIEWVFKGNKNLGKLRAMTDRDISDPWYTGNFESTYNDIIKGCNAYFKSLGL